MHSAIILITLSWPQQLFKISSFVVGTFFLALAITFSIHANAQLKASPTENPSDKMTLQQKVGQLFIWTYPGNSYTPFVQKWVEKYQPGGLIAFSRNISSAAQIARLNSQLQKLATEKLKTPLFLMIDQEGGVVTRLKTVVPLPSALALGGMDDVEFTKSFGQSLGAMIKSFGFNVNLAPVLDVTNPNKDSFIGSRAFGNDPNKVSRLAGAFSEGLSLSGVMPTAKHFPGHGGVVQDSHLTIPNKLTTMEELSDRDLIPFEEYSQIEMPSAIMMAHIALPNIDPSGLPSTYSTALVDELLRKKLGYQGLIVTDDLEMNGASAQMTIAERSVKAFLAGNDMLMLAGSGEHQRQAYEAIIAAIKDKRISEARLSESVNRILRIKSDLKIGSYEFNQREARNSVVELESLSKKVLTKNFKKALFESNRAWPIASKDSNVLVLTSDRRIFRSFKFKFPGKTDLYHLTPKSLKGVVTQAKKSKYDFIVYYASGSQTSRWLKVLPPEIKAKTIVINANHAGEVEVQTTFLAVLNINTHYPTCGNDLAEFLIEAKIRAPSAEPLKESPPVEPEEPLKTSESSG